MVNSSGSASSRNSGWGQGRGSGSREWEKASKRYNIRVGKGVFIYNDKKRFYSANVFRFFFLISSSGENQFPPCYWRNMAAAYALQCGLCCIISGWFHVNVTVTNSFSSEMCLRVSHAAPPWASAWHSYCQVTPLLRVLFAMIMRMFIDHPQVLVYIKDSLKNSAVLSTSSQICTLFSPCVPASFPLSVQKHLSSYHNSTHNLLALEWVQYGGEKPRIAFESLMPRLTTWVGF